MAVGQAASLVVFLQGMQQLVGHRPEQHMVVGQAAGLVVFLRGAQRLVGHRIINLLCCSFSYVIPPWWMLTNKLVMLSQRKDTIVAFGRRATLPGIF